jgi:uncharacterized membrane protein
VSRDQIIVNQITTIYTRENNNGLIINNILGAEMSVTSFLSSQTNPQFMYLFLILVVWELIWKGIALWKAAREGQKYWFLVILILNTIGILPILYIFVFKKGRKGI